MELRFAKENVIQFQYLPAQSKLVVLTFDGDLIVYNKDFSVLFMEHHEKAYNFFATENKILVSSHTQSIIINSAEKQHSADYSIQIADYAFNLPGDRFEEVMYYLTYINGVAARVELNKDFEVKRVLDFTVGINGIDRLLSKETCISSTDEVIGLFSLQDGAEIWRLDAARLLGTDDPTNSNDFIYVDGKLYFFLYSIDKMEYRAAFCIDEKTGKVLNRFDGFGEHLQLFKKQIYTTRRYQVSMLDVATNKIETWVFKESLDAAKLSINSLRWVVEEGLLYFVDGIGRPKDRVGILNLQTGEVVWETKIVTTDDAGKCINKIRVHNGKLFVYASDKRLHVFERNI